MSEHSHTAWTPLVNHRATESQSSPHVLCMLEWSLSSHCMFALRPRQNGHHFADDIFKCISLNENVWIPIKILLKFVPKSPINNIPSLVQISHYLSQWWLAYWRIYASLGLNELITHLGTSKTDWGKPWMEDISNLIDIHSKNSFQVLDLHYFLRFWLCPSNDILEINEKIMLVLGPPFQRQETFVNKANTS